MAVYAIRDTKINLNDRICQFRIIEKMPSIEFVEVKTLDNEDRGGLGSTGVLWLKQTEITPTIKVKNIEY